MENLLKSMRQAVENKTAKVLTLDLAKQLIGKRIQTIYFGYRGQDGTDDFVVGEIVSDLEYHRNLNEDCYKNNPKFKNRAEYWESYMSESELNARKNSLKLIAADGRDTYIITQPNENVFTCSDADRYVYFVEVSHEN